MRPIRTGSTLGGTPATTGTRSSRRPRSCTWRRAPPAGSARSCSPSTDAADAGGSGPVVEVEQRVGGQPVLDHVVAAADLRELGLRVPPCRLAQDIGPRIA